MRARFLEVSALIGLLFFTATEARQRKTPVADAEKGAIAVKIRTKGPTALSERTHAVEVYFVKVEEGVDPFSSEEVLVSNFELRRQVYLLNADPGRYVAVGAYAEGFGESIDDRVYFDMEMIPATEVTVEPGQIAFMGDIEVKLAVGMIKADAAQKHYGDLLGRGWKPSVHVSGNSKTGERSTSFDIDYEGIAGSLKSLDRSPEAERKFLEYAAKKVFKHEPDWQELARKQIEP